MTKIAIVYHSGYGHTKKQAEAVTAGAKSAGAETYLMDTAQAEKEMDKLNSMDAIIFGAPTYMGSLSAPMKQFMDATGRLWMDQKWKDKVAAGFTNSGSPSGDKLNSLMQLAIFAAQHSMIWVGLGMMPHADAAGNKDKGEFNRLGSFMGAMSQSDNASPEITPPPEDLETAKMLGIRVAKFAKKLAA